MPQLDLLWFFFVVYFVFTTQRTPPICALQTSHDHCLPVTFLSLLYYFLLFTFLKSLKSGYLKNVGEKRKTVDAFAGLIR